MDEEVWRPLGVDSEEEIAEYDALHDGVPDWMSAPFWAWVRESITCLATYREDLYGGRHPIYGLRVAETEQMCQILQIRFPDLNKEIHYESDGTDQLDQAMFELERVSNPLILADYILAFFDNVDAGKLDKILERSKSAWLVSEHARAGRPGLIRRVPKGVQEVANAVMTHSGNAGIELSKAWECLYGIDPKPGEAYSHAIKSVEDAAIPVVSPQNSKATLGTVLNQMSDQKNWRLPMLKEDQRSTSSQTLLDMIGLLWRGQHDRHGGVESQPVTVEEATVAVGLATSLVQFFDAGLVQRSDEDSQL